MKHSVSVIIPNYNHEKYLDKRIESVLQQTYTNYELIILDDCSTDRSRVIIEKYRAHPKVTTIIYNETNSGSPFKQWQKGIELAKGEWIWIAESDDYSDPTFLEKLINRASDYRNLGLIFSNSVWVDKNGEPGASLSIYNESFHRTGTQEIYFLLQHNTIQNVSSAIIQADAARVAVQHIGSFKACGDWLFYIKILEKSDICYTSEPLNYYRWYHNNVSNNAEKGGLWILEGIKILSLLQPKNILIGKRQLLQLNKLWFSRIRSFPGFSLSQRIAAIKTLTHFSLKFLLPGRR